MKTKIKSNGIYLKSLAITVLPLALLASCSAESSIVNIDLQQSSSQTSVITLAEIRNISYEPEEINESKFMTIKKVFDIAENNIETITEGLWVHKNMLLEENQYELILTAKPGFEINGNLNSLKSNSFIAFSNNFEITTNPTEEINKQHLTHEEMLLFNTEKHEIDETHISTIKKVFDLSEMHNIVIMNNLEVKKNLDPEKPHSYNLVLIAKDGFLINGLLSLTSFTFNCNPSIDLTINPKQSEFINVTEEELKNFNLEFQDVNLKTMEIIKKVFDISIDDDIAIKSLKVKMEEVFVGQNKYKLSLMSNDGFTINGQKESILSNSFIVDINFDVVIEGGIILLSNEEINLISNVESDIDKNSLQVIKKVFNFSLPNIKDEQIMYGLKVKITEPTPANQYQITLMAKPNFTINGKK